MHSSFGFNSNQTFFHPHPSIHPCDRFTYWMDGWLDGCIHSATKLDAMDDEAGGVVCRLFQLSLLSSNQSEAIRTTIRRTKHFLVNSRVQKRVIDFDIFVCGISECSFKKNLRFPSARYPTHIPEQMLAR